MAMKVRKKLHNKSCKALARCLLFSSCLIPFSLPLSTFAQEERPVYPANSTDVSYAELDNLPDWRGIWHPAFGQVSGDDPILKGKYKEFYEEQMARLEANPNYEIPERSSNCEPPGMPYMMTMPYSLEFSFTPGKIIVVQEAHMQVRRIFTDGRPLPDNPDYNYFGYSSGHWEGNTLVVKTIGTKPGLRLGIRGITNSDKLTIHERIYLDESDPDILHLDFTYVDPEVLEQPWHQNYIFHRDREWEILEYICDENDRHPINSEGQSDSILDH